jgi:hypothetical protein
MKKIIFLFSLVFLFFGLGNNNLVSAEEIIDVTPPTVTSYSFNGIEDNVVFNPNNPASVEIVINTDEPVKFNRIKIINNESMEVKFFTAFNNFDTSAVKTWDGKSDGVVVPDGVYSLQVNIKDVAENTNNNLNLTPFTITVDTSEILVGDTISPTIEFHEDVTVETTSSEGIIVDYIAPNATDNVDTMEPAVCEPTSGSLFSIDTTEITCNKTDSAGNIAIPVTFNVIVQDTTPPENDGSNNTTPTPNSVNINLKIYSGETSLYDNNISVTACDSDNKPETPDDITAYCAVLQTELESDWSWYGDGVFVDSIEDIVGYTSQDDKGDNVYHYWSWFLNENYGETGLNQYKLKSNDLISLEFIDPVTEKEDEENQESNSNNNGSSSGGSSNSTKTFSVPEALDFLFTNKASASVFVYDWIAIAAGAGDNSILKSSLVEYLKSNPINSSFVTENERRAMALMALGINPYNGTEINYIKKITDSFNGIQIKDESLSDFNDDIFGLIVLQKVGYDESDDMIKRIILYILSKQSDDGSWGSIDMTGAGIMALNEFRNVKDVENAISKALSYIVEMQDDDGGFENIYSTSWAVQALSLSDSYEKEVKDGIDYLAENQEEDGGVVGENTSNRIWATAYAIPAVLKLSWNDILDEFDNKEVLEKISTELEEDEVSTEKKVYTYLDFIDEAEPEDTFEEVKDENIGNEDLGEESATFSESDLLASAEGSVSKGFLDGDKIIWFVVVILFLIFGSFVLKRKI